MNQEIHGNGNKQTYIKCQKAETINNNFRMSEEQFNNCLTILKEQLSSVYNSVLSKDALDSVIAATIDEAVAKKYREQCQKQGSSVDSLTKAVDEVQITVDEIRSSAKDTLDKVKGLVCKNAKEQKAEFETLKETIKFSTRNLYRLGEQNLYYSRLTHDLCTKLFGEVNGIKDLLVKEIFGEDGIFKKTLDLAEMRHEQLASAASKVATKEASAILAGLDQRDVVEMFNWIKEIHKHKDDGVTKIQELIVDHRQGLQAQIDGIKDVVDSIKGDTAETRNNCVKILEKTVAIYNIGTKAYELEIKNGEMLEQVMKSAERSEKRLENLEKALTEKDEMVQNIATKVAKMLGQQVESVLNRIQDEGPDAIKKDLNEMDRLSIEDKKELDVALTQLADKQKEIETLQRRVAILSDDGLQFDNGACPFCGVIARRNIIGYECICDVCGHRFAYKDLDPNMRGRDISIEDKETLLTRWKEDREKPRATQRSKDEREGQAWRRRHTARLEKVSSKNGNDFYRMQLKPYTVSSNGVLIIPTKDTKPDTTGEWGDGKVIKKITFCEPNTDDEFSRQELQKVKTLFLGEDISLGEIDGIYPFSDMKRLTKVMRYDKKNNGYIEDKDSEDKIKEKNHE